jgi:FKBP-type peptidyl-prolyl cis-trans isomerase SlyD
MQITKDRVVSFAYTLTDEEGTVLDSSEGGEPLVYLHGHGGIIEGLESEMEGKDEGSAFDCTIPPEQAYGAYDPELDIAVPLEAFPEEHREELQPGVRFQGPHPADQTQPVIYTVHLVEPEVVKVSGNHALAGRTLHFQIEVVDVRDATPEELEHGHVHGAGGHQH